MLARMQRNQITSARPVEMQNGIVIVKNNPAVSFKAKDELNHMAQQLNTWAFISEK